MRATSDSESTTLSREDWIKFAQRGLSNLDDTTFFKKYVRSLFSISPLPSRHLISPHVVDTPHPHPFSRDIDIKIDLIQFMAVHLPEAVHTAFL